MSVLASATRAESRSHAAMILALSCFQSPGRSGPREIRPLPIAPMLIRFPGELAPRTDAGTIDGKPVAPTVEAEAAIPAAATARNSRRVAPLLFCNMSLVIFFTPAGPHPRGHSPLT